VNVDRLRDAILDVPDFPKPGILFKDLTPILLDPDLFREATALFVDRHRDAQVDKVAVIEARGFLFGAAVAHELGAGLVPIRKKGKLPRATREVSYDLEYGSATLELHEDAVNRGDKVLVIDDLLATGGTAAASAQALRDLGAEIVEFDFLVELAFLNGREKLDGLDVFAPIVF
jgi:adenine phosphoribosyltransferase